jgi:uncharacterized membrane protein YbaN (DUF454 family)
MTRIPYFCFGWLMLVLAAIGAVLPLMPTTIFLILAAWGFARSSPRLEQWLLDHPRFGPTLRNWRDYGAISTPTKAMACAGMAFGFSVFWLSAHPAPWVVVGVAAFMLASALYVISRPGNNAVTRSDAHRHGSRRS